VVIADYSKDAAGAILDGVVIAHARSREEFLPIAATFPRRVAIWFMGDPLHGGVGIIGTAVLFVEPTPSGRSAGSPPSRL
jgi:hypothetical protein